MGSFQSGVVWLFMTGMFIPAHSCLLVLAWLVTGDKDVHFLVGGGRLLPSQAGSAYAWRAAQQPVFAC